MFTRRGRKACTFIFAIMLTIVESRCLSNPSSLGQHLNALSKQLPAQSTLRHKGGHLLSIVNDTKVFQTWFQDVDCTYRVRDNEKPPQHLAPNCICVQNDGSEVEVKLDGKTLEKGQETKLGVGQTISYGSTEYKASPSCCTDSASCCILPSWAARDVPLCMPALRHAGHASLRPDTQKMMTLPCALSSCHSKICVAACVCCEASQMASGL